MAKAKTIQSNEEDIILGKIHFIRNCKVMVDKDLAALYGVQPIRLREQVKRNSARFPETFMFQLTNNETMSLNPKGPLVTSLKKYGGSLPYAFTEHGVLMLANVLKSERAVQVSLKIIEIFVKMRELLSTSKDVLLKLEQLEKKITSHDQEIQIIFSTLKQLLDQPTEKRDRIGFRRENEKD